MLLIISRITIIVNGLSILLLIPNGFPLSFDRYRLQNLPIFLLFRCHIKLIHRAPPRVVFSYSLKFPGELSFRFLSKKMADGKNHLRQPSICYEFILLPAPRQYLRQCRYSCFLSLRDKTPLHNSSRHTQLEVRICR